MIETELMHFWASMLLVFSSILPPINPVGSAMFYLSMTNGLSPIAKAKLSRRVAIYCFLVLIVSFYVGNFILKFFGISIDVLRVAGGIVLFSVGWQVLNSPSQEEVDMPIKERSESKLKNMAFYPFTLPLTTGPGSISVAVALGATPARDVGDVLGCITGMILNCLVIWVCYRYSDRVTRSLGVAGADALTRIFSFILICLGVSIFWTGFSGLWLTLPR